MKLEEYFNLNSLRKQVSKEVKNTMHLNHEQTLILYYMLNTEGHVCNLKDIEEHIELSKSLTSRYVKDLIDKNYITKEWSIEDERIRVLKMNEDQVENALTTLELVEEYINIQTN